MRAAALLAVVAGSLAALPAAALAGPPGAEPHLSVRLNEVADSSLRTASAADQNQAVGLARSGAGSLLRRGSDLIVEIRLADAPAAHTADLRQAGADIIDVSGEYRTVTAAVPISSLKEIANVEGVESVNEVLTPSVDQATIRSGPIASAGSPCGTATTEGDTQLKADTARSHYGVDGTGVTVGVLSDSYDKNASAATHASGDVASGDLPGAGDPCGHTTPVNVLDDTGTGADEGRGMLQLVHDLAPGAKLAFATAFTGELAFANNIRTLQTSGAKVIADDVSYFDEPFYQDGPITKAVDDVVAAGSTYFSSAANNNFRSTAGTDIGSYEAPAFRPSTACVGGTALCHDFDPGAGTDPYYRFDIPAGRSVSVILQWAEPWYDVTTDLDLYLLDTGHTGYYARSINHNTGVSGSQEPFEALSYTNSGGSTLSVDLAVPRLTTGARPTPRFKLVFNGSPTNFEYQTPGAGDTLGPSIFGHNGARSAISTAAVPYFDSSSIEPFSSRGPVTLVYGPVNGTTPAAALPAPITVNKPDISATDGGQTTFFAQYDGAHYRFFGTSAAAPHAAGVAALQLQRTSTATPAQIKTAQASTARQVGTFGPLAEGAGLIDADAALGALTATAVRWRGGSARVDARGVIVRWNGTDDDVLGYQVLRARRGHTARRRVSHLVTTVAARSGRYRLTDRHGRRGDRYFVVERSLAGHRTVHGPLVARR